MKTKIGIILGTTRTNSLGARIFKYLQATLSATDVELTFIDLHDYPLPFYDHEETPLSQPIQHLNSVEQQWLDVLAAQAGYLILSPEYDHAITGSLKNALDFVGPEVDHKPIQIVTYSHYTDGGMLAASSLVGILQMLKMMVLPTPVLLWEADQDFDVNGQLLPAAPNRDYFATRLQAAFAELVHYAGLMQEHPWRK